VSTDPKGPHAWPAVMVATGVEALRRGDGPHPWRALMVAAGAEALRRGDRRLGTDHLLLGLLQAPDNVAAAALGTDIEAARRALDALDEAALAAVGVHVDALDGTPTGCAGRRTPTLSSGARNVLVRALALRSRNESVGPQHILLALLETAPPDPAAQLVGALALDREAARRRLVEGASRQAI
jgi:ATP-dependent Clp protease ATP-binding subunit ClpA